METNEDSIDIYAVFAKILKKLDNLIERWGGEGGTRLTAVPVFDLLASTAVISPAKPG